MLLSLQLVTKHEYLDAGIWRDTLECEHVLEGKQFYNEVARRRCPICPPPPFGYSPAVIAAKERYRKSEIGAEANRRAVKKYRILHPERVRAYEQDPDRMAARNASGKRRYYEKKLEFAKNDTLTEVLKPDFFPESKNATS